MKKTKTLLVRNKWFTEGGFTNIYELISEDHEIDQLAFVNNETGVLWQIGDFISYDDFKNANPYKVLPASVENIPSNAYLSLI